jgi:hypothetical protein
MMQLLSQISTVRTSGAATCIEYAMNQLPYDSADVLCLEFGVFSGTTLGIMANTRPMATIIGFDSFEGLPERWRDNFEKGAFDLQSQIPPTIPENSAVFKGWFENTIPRLKQIMGERKVDLVHIDCDIYSSTKSIFDLLGENIRWGTFLVFDELLNYPGYAEHEMKALYEFCVQNPDKQVEVIGMLGEPVMDDMLTWDQAFQQAIVRIW